MTVSVGLSSNKFLAKIASDLDKPRGFAIIGRAETDQFLARQPVGVIWGVGRAAVAALEREGIRTIADLRARPQGARAGNSACSATGSGASPAARTPVWWRPAATPSRSPTRPPSPTISPTLTLSPGISGRSVEQLSARAKAHELGGKGGDAQAQAGGFHRLVPKADPRVADADGGPHLPHRPADAAPRHRPGGPSACWESGFELGPGRPESRGDDLLDRASARGAPPPSAPRTAFEPDLAGNSIVLGRSLR